MSAEYKFVSQTPINKTKLYIFLHICLAIVGERSVEILYFLRSIAMEPYFQSFHCPAASVSRQILASFRILASDRRVFVPIDFIIINFE